MRIYVGSLLWKYAIALPCLGSYFGGINGRLTMNSIQVSHFNYLNVLVSFWTDTKHWYCCENHIFLHLPQPQPHSNPGAFASSLLQSAYCVIWSVTAICLLLQKQPELVPDKWLQWENAQKDNREMNFLLWVTKPGGEVGPTRMCP